MTTGRQKIAYGILGVAFVAGCILFAIWTVDQHHRTDAVHQTAVITEGRTIGTAQLGGAFELIDQRGARRRDTDFKGQYMLVYFGYRFCPDICPTALHTMTEALASLGRTAYKIQPIFITVDPGRDRPKDLAIYMENYDPRFVALSGDDNQIEAAKQAYKVFAAPVTPDGTTSDYLMDHSSIIYLMGPQGQFLAHYNHTIDPAQLGNSLRQYIR